MPPFEVHGDELLLLKQVHASQSLCGPKRNGSENSCRRFRSGFLKDFEALKESLFFASAGVEGCMVSHIKLQSCHCEE